MTPLKELSLSDLAIIRDKAVRKYQQHQINKDRNERLHEIGEDLANQAWNLVTIIDQIIKDRVMYYIKEYN